MNCGDRKKGISSVVATVLLIVVALVLVGVVFAWVMPMFNDSLTSSEICSAAIGDLTLVDEGYTGYFLNDTDSWVNVQVRRGGASGFELIGFKVIVYDNSGNSEGFLLKNVLLGKNSADVYVIPNGFNESVKSVSIAPIVLVGDVEKECGVINTVNLNSLVNVVLQNSGDVDVLDSSGENSLDIPNEGGSDGGDNELEGYFIAGDGDYIDTGVKLQHSTQMEVVGRFTDLDSPTLTIFSIGDFRDFQKVLVLGVYPPTHLGDLGNKLFFQKYDGFFESFKMDLADHIYFFSRDSIKVDGVTNFSGLSEGYDNLLGEEILLFAKHNQDYYFYTNFAMKSVKIWTYPIINNPVLVRNYTKYDDNCLWENVEGRVICSGEEYVPLPELNLGSITLYDRDFDDYWDISDCDELQAMNYRLDEKYELTQDIDCSDTITWNLGVGFKSIGNESQPFEGIFNGQGNVVEGLSISDSNIFYAGLFGYVKDGAEIKNVGLVDFKLWGEVVGTVAGYSEGLIDSVYAQEGELAGLSEGVQVGGLIGVQGIDGVLSNSYTWNDIETGENLAGGLVESNLGQIINSYSSLEGMRD
jgi:flagellin-like protein